MSDADILPSDSGPERVIQQVVSSGLELGAGLRMYAREYPLAIRQQLLKLAEAVESGQTLSEAAQASNFSLAPYLSAIIEGGQRAQRLGPMLDEYLTLRWLQRRLTRSTSLSLAYPLFVLYSTVVLCVIIMTWIVPLFEHIFEDFGIQLPVLTSWFIEASRITVYLIVPLSIGLIATGVVLLLFVFWGRGTRAVLEHVPILGTAVQYATMSEFCSLLAPLVEASVPLPIALRAVAQGMWPSKLRRRTRSMAEGYDGSFLLADVAAACRMPGEIVHVLQWETRGQGFGDILRSWGELFSQYSERRTNMVSIVLTPVMMISISLFVGLIVVVMFQPLLKLLNDLS